jgi:hypothetical protein
MTACQWAQANTRPALQPAVRPALASARPDFNTGRYASAAGLWVRQEARFTDRQWRPVTVLGRWADLAAGWC